MANTVRNEILKNFRSMNAKGIPIIGGGAGVGLSAKAQIAGGIDFLVVYNSGRFRMAGHGSLAGLMPYGNANDVMLELVPEIMSVAGTTPIVAGVCGTDPLRSMDRILDEVQKMGCAGIQNFPTVGLIDGVFRQNLEESGMPYQAEAEMVANAVKRGLLTVVYVFNPNDARLMADAGADIIVVHFGLTTGGTIGAETAVALEDTIEGMNDCAKEAMAAKPDVLLLCHGGPLATPSDAEFVIHNAEYCHGFLGASSMERLPTEVAIAQNIGEFKKIEMKETG